MFKSFQKIAVIFGILLFVTVAASAQEETSKEVKNAAKTAQKATKALDKIMSISDKSIPQDLLAKAKAIAVFPGVVKAAFIIGGAGGKGLISRRLDSGWSAPAFFKIAGGSVGFQLGGSSTDVVMLFMTNDSLENLLESQFELGAGASVAAGPVGRSASASTDAQFQAAILTYSRTKGVFAGVSLAGSVLSPDNDANLALYNLPAKTMLTGTNKIALADIPPATRPFQQAVTHYAR
ncbi:MAG: lipid-binding SYLF domain-containing protein [Acidobacteriota bacterium]